MTIKTADLNVLCSLGKTAQVSGVGIRFDRTPSTLLCDSLESGNGRRPGSLPIPNSVFICSFNESVEEPGHSGDRRWDNPMCHRYRPGSSDTILSSGHTAVVAARQAALIHRGFPSRTTGQSHIAGRCRLSLKPSIRRSVENRAMSDEVCAGSRASVPQTNSPIVEVRPTARIAWCFPPGPA